MKPTMKCPLSLPEADLLPENLDAAVARGRASVFGSLPYSPTELETVRLVAEKITEASRLGFEQVEIPDTRLSDQFTKTLTDRGFHVRAKVRIWWMDSYKMEPQLTWMVRMLSGYSAAHSVLISWAEEAPPQERPVQEILDEAEKEKAERQAQFDQEFEERNQKRDEFKTGEPWKTQVGPYLIEPTPPRSGCLAILLTLLIPLGLIAAVITTNI